MSKTGRPKDSRGRLWTPSEIEYLREHYNDGLDVLTKHFDCCKQRVANKISQLRLPRIYRRFSAARAFVPPVGDVPQERSPPLAVPAAMLRLAEFDPVVRRAVQDRLAGRTKPSFAPGENSIGAYSPAQRDALARGRKNSGFGRAVASDFRRAHG